MHKEQLIKHLQSLQKYYLEGDGYDSGSWMQEDDNRGHGEEKYIKAEDIDEVIKSLTLTKQEFICECEEPILKKRMVW